MLRLSTRLPTATVQGRLAHLRHTECAYDFHTPRACCKTLHQLTDHRIDRVLAIGRVGRFGFVAEKRINV